MTNDVYLCFDCGTKNRVSVAGDRSRAKCAKCKANLFPEEASKSRSSNSHGSDGRPVSTTPPTSPSQEGTGKAKVLVGLVAVGILIAFLVNNEERSYQSPPRAAATPVTQTIPPAPLPPAVSQSAGIIFNKTGVSGNHPLEIVTSPGNDYFVKLVDNITNAERIGIFVKGGQRIEVEVPAGQYRMRYASGETWRGMQHLFGPGNMTSYQASSDIFNFNISGGYYNGYTIELIRQVGGNMDTRSISASSF